MSKFAAKTMVTIYDVAANHFLSHTEGKRVRDHADYGETLKL